MLEYNIRLNNVWKCIHFLFPINTPCGQSVELLNVEVDGTYTYHGVLKDETMIYTVMNAGI
jgi:hypothetical protein